MACEQTSVPLRNAIKRSRLHRYKFIVAALVFSLSQFDPSAAAVLAVSLLHTGLAERSHRMTETTKRRQKARQSGSKKKGSEVRGQKRSEKTAIVKLRHAILALGEGCNTSLMSANFSEAVVRPAIHFIQIQEVHVELHSSV